MVSLRKEFDQLNPTVCHFIPPKKMQITSLITGKVRDEAKALDTTRALVALRSEGIVDLIIFSTWMGELDAYPALKDYFRQQNIFVVEAPEQKMSIQESHQKIPLLAALNLLDANNYVTRHRFDRVKPSPTFREHLVAIRAHGTEATSYSWTPNKHRITVNSALLDVPFFLSDIVFSGMRDDLLELISIDGMTQLYWSNHINPEFSFFANGFMPYYPEIGDYLATYPGLSYGNEEKWKALKLAQRDTEFYARITALYYFLVSACFQVGYGGKTAPQGDQPISLETLLFEYGGWRQYPDTRWFGQAGHPYVKSREKFDAMVAGKYAASDFSARLGHYLEYYKQHIPTRKRIGLPKLSSEALGYAQSQIAHGLRIPPFAGQIEQDGLRHKYWTSQIGGSEATLQRNSSAQEWGEWEVF
jgi:hypothetical protein